MMTHAGRLDTDHPHPAPVVTVMVPLPPETVNPAETGESV
jgi:hypothetical protein